MGAGADLKRVLDREKRAAAREAGPALAPQEADALRRLRREARGAGATLSKGGKGGLPPSVALGAFRRHAFKCCFCGTTRKVSLHHRGGTPHLVDGKLRALGKANVVGNLVVVCDRCHDTVHDADRAIEAHDGATRAEE